MPVGLYDEEGNPLVGIKLRERLGIPQVSPRNLTRPVTTINGVDVWFTKQEGPFRRKFGMRHRLLAECPVCKKVFSAGKLNVHIKAMHKDL